MTTRSDEGYGGELQGELIDPVPNVVPSVLTARALEVLLALIAGLTSIPVFHRLAADFNWRIQGLNDFRIHMMLTRGVDLWPPKVLAPQALFHVCTRLVGTVVTLPVAAALVLGLACALTAGLIFRIGQGQDSPFAQPLPTGITALLVIGYVWAESPNVIIWGRHLSGPGFIYWMLHMWGNPTSMVGFPLVFGLLMLVVRELDGYPARWPRVERASLPLLIVLSALAKPNFLMALAPAVFLVLAVRRDLTWERFRWFGLSIVVPGLLVGSWQYWFAKTQIPKDEFAFGIKWAPLYFARQLGIFHWYLWTVFWPVVLGLWVGRRRFLQDSLVQLCLLAVGCALVPMLLLTETSEKMGGNFGFGFYLTYVPLYVASLRFLFVEAVAAYRGRVGRRRLRPWCYLLLVMFALSVASGVVMNLGGAGVLAAPTS